MSLKHLLASALMLTFALSLSAQSGIDPYELDVKDFDELKVTDGINVEYFSDASRAGKVAFEATSDVANAIIFEPNKKGKLEIKLATRDIVFKNLPTVRVYSSYLTKVENSGDSTVSVASVKCGPKFEAKLIGNGALRIDNVDTSRLNASLSTGKGTITITGRASLAKLNLTGTGEIDALGLHATDAEVKLIGTGWVKCDVESDLNVTGMGTGTVSFKGNPITRVKALSVKVKRIE